MKHRPTRAGHLGAVVAAVGLAVLAVGTFLPWFRSGEVLRDSYQSISVIRTLRLVDGSPLRWVIAGWLALVPLITACLAGYAVGLRRLAATMSTVIAILTGTVAAGATIEGSGGTGPIGLAVTGPATMLVGAVVAVVGAVGVFTGRREHATDNAGGEP